MSVLSFISNKKLTVNREIRISVGLQFHDISLRHASFSMHIHVSQVQFLESLRTANDKLSTYCGPRPLKMAKNVSTSNTQLYTDISARRFIIYDNDQ